MALSTRLIRSKIKAVGNIRKITKAMELVSASKMKRSVSQALATREYSTEALNLLVHIAGERSGDHALLHPGRGKAILVMIVASNKGLCGSFNVNTLKSAGRFIKEKDFINRVEFVTIGKNAERGAKKTGRPVIASFTDLPDNLSIDDVGGLRKVVIDEFLSGKYERAFVVYMNYVSALQYQPVIRELLPVNPEIIKNIIEEIGGEATAKEVLPRNLALYLFEPDEAAVLDIVLPRLVETTLYQALLESLASEHSARMFAMKNATDNASELLDDLTLNYNHARQDAVTREISEIAAGAAVGKE